MGQTLATPIHVGFSTFGGTHSQIDANYMNFIQKKCIQSECWFFVIQDHCVAVCLLL